MTPTGIACVVAMLSAAIMAADPKTPVTCKASDYRTGAEFDLSELENTIPEQADGQTIETYMISPCGKRPANWDDECSFPYACQNAGAKKYKLATQVYRDKLQPLITDGTTPKGARLVMRNGDKCHNGEMRSLTVHYYCEPDGKKRVKIVESFHCSYDLLVYDKHACPSMPSPAKPSANPCTLTDGSNHYDLSPLKKLTGNHVVTERDLYDAKEASISDEYEFIINVCQDININKAYAHDSALRNCHNDGDFPGICQVYYDDSEPFLPHYRMLGQTAVLGTNDDYAKLKMVNDVLTLKYDRGTKYSSSEARRSSEIRFFCLAGSGIGAPEFEREDSELGVYYFTWTTEYACPNRKSASGGGMSGGAIFALIIFVIIPCTLLLYCVVGIFCNRQSGKTGIDMVPHIDILRNVFSCCSSSGTNNGLSIQADGEVGQSLMDDEDYD